MAGRGWCRGGGWYVAHQTEKVAAGVGVARTVQGAVGVLVRYGGPVVRGTVLFNEAGEWMVAGRVAQVRASMGVRMIVYVESFKLWRLSVRGCGARLFFRGCVLSDWMVCGEDYCSEGSGEGG